MSAELLALLDSDPAAGILAVADLREQRVNNAMPAPLLDRMSSAAEYIAAEANPALTRAAVRRWRGVVERHTLTNLVYTDGRICDWCDGVQDWPCPDLTETADEARAYLGGAS